MGSGNYIGFACGPLKRPRYINERIEQELVEFKQEIEERFAESRVNTEFRFPRNKKLELKQIQLESSQRVGREKTRASEQTASSNHTHTHHSIKLDKKEPRKSGDLSKPSVESSLLNMIKQASDSNHKQTLQMQIQHQQAMLDQLKTFAHPPKPSASANHSNNYINFHSFY